MIKTTCDNTDDDEESDEKLAKMFGLKMPCDGLEYVVYIPVVQLKGKRF